MEKQQCDGVDCEAIMLGGRVALSKRTMIAYTAAVAAAVRGR